MRMRDWEKKIKQRPLSPGEKFMLDVVFKSIKHGNARHKNWLKRKCLELGYAADKIYNTGFFRGHITGSASQQYKIRKVLGIKE